jgi:hypothetical protein
VVTEKATDKHISNILARLGLPMDADGNRRLLDILRWLRIPRLAAAASADDMGAHGSDPAQRSTGRENASCPTA